MFIACILCVTAITGTAFADTEASSNWYGVITDADGNVVEVLTMTRTLYVDSIHTIPAGGSFVSYQYEPDESFIFGFLNHDIKFDKNKTEYELIVENNISKIGVFSSETKSSIPRTDMFSNALIIDGTKINLSKKGVVK